MNYELSSNRLMILYLMDKFSNDYFGGALVLKQKPL